MQWKEVAERSAGLPQSTSAVAGSLLNSSSCSPEARLLMELFAYRRPLFVL
jgi:hypothetical protein